MENLTKRNHLTPRMRKDQPNFMVFDGGFIVSAQDILGESKEAAARANPTRRSAHVPLLHPNICGEHSFRYRATGAKRGIDLGLAMAYKYGLGYRDYDAQTVEAMYEVSTDRFKQKLGKAIITGDYETIKQCQKLMEAHPEYF